MRSMSHRRCRKDGYGVGAILSSTEGSIAMNTDLNVAGTMMTNWLLSPCCLHAGIRDHQGSAGSAVAAATEMSAELLFAVLAVIVLFGVAIVVSLLGKPTHERFCQPL